MADTARFIVSLKDKLSGPAKKATGSMADLERQMGLTRDAQGRLRQANGRFATDAQKAALGIGNQSKQVRILGASLGMLKYGALTASVVAATGAVLTFNRAVQTERTVSMLDRLTKDGAQSFDNISKLAVDFGLDIDKTAKSYGDFLKLQFSQDQAKNMIKLGADMQALGNTADDVQGIFRAMGQIKSKDKLQAEEILQLAERGVSGKLIRQNVAKLMGVGINEVEKLQRQGKVSGDIGLAAIEGALNQKLKQSKAGESGKEFVKNTMAGAVGAAKSQAEKFWINLAQEASPGLKAGLSGALEAIRSFANSKRGARVVEFLATSFRKLGEAAELMMPLLAEMGTELASSFVDSFGAAQDTVAQLFGPNGIASGADWVGYMRSNVIPAVRDLGTFLGNVASALVTISRVGGMVVASLGDIKTGIELVLNPMGASVTGAQWAIGLIGGMKSALGIASPSKEMKKLGKYTEQGFQIGQNRQARNPGPNLSGTGAIFSGAAQAVSSGSRSGGGDVSVGDITIQVSGAGDPEAVGAATMAAFEANLSSVLNRFQAEVGA